MKQNRPAAAPLPANKQQVLALLKDNRVEQAESYCAQWHEASPGSADALLLHASILKRQGRFTDMLRQAKSALQLVPRHPGARLQFIEGCIYCGQVSQALDELSSLEADTGNDPELLQHIAGFYTHCIRHEEAARCYRRSLAIQPDNPSYNYNLSASLIALGELDEAENLLTKVIQLNPQDYDAYQNRSTLKKQTADSNHIDELSQRLDRLTGQGGGEVQLCYALSKEFEDIGDYQQAFSYLQRGADKRRSLMGYQVETDLAAMGCIQKVFGKQLLEGVPSSSSEPGPIFVMGLPRSGTTLVDRIISSHSQVCSLGEINDFAFSLIRAIGGSRSKLDMVEASAAIDFPALGQAYLDSAKSYGEAATNFIDKTPLNFLYIGLVCLALPQARIIHLRRNPMDSCYAMYKTLFRMGYPFSYDLDDLARYYLAYRKLMDHWRQHLPGRFIDIDYETLVQNQEPVSREMIAYCGLDWEDACLQFHRNPSPAATASAAQVRQPVYRSSLSRWRCYEAQLKPLSDQLLAADIALELDSL